MNILDENWKRYRQLRKAWKELWKIKKDKAVTSAHLRELETKEEMLNKFIEENNDLTIIPPYTND